MQRLLIGITAIALVGFLVFKQFGQQPLGPKETIESGVQQVKAQGEITPKQEAVLRVQLAVADYAATHGKAPDSIDELVPTYFDTLPIDPDTGKPIATLDGSTDSSSDGGAVVVASAATTADEILEREGYINPNNMQMSTFVYDPAGKRDPFQPFDFSSVGAVDDSLPPLQRYSIGQLKVTAIIKDQRSGDLKAFIEDATGIGYPVNKGTRVGTDNGIVVKITEEAVYVVETRTDFTGKKHRTTVEMKLQRASSEDKNAKFQRIRNRERSDRTRRR